MATKANFLTTLASLEDDSIGKLQLGTKLCCLWEDDVSHFHFILLSNASVKVEIHRTKLCLTLAFPTEHCCVSSYLLVDLSCIVWCNCGVRHCVKCLSSTMTVSQILIIYINKPWKEFSWSCNSSEGAEGRYDVIIMSHKWNILAFSCRCTRSPPAGQNWQQSILVICIEHVKYVHNIKHLLPLPMTPWQFVWYKLFCDFKLQTKAESQISFP